MTFHDCPRLWFGPLNADKHTQIGKMWLENKESDICLCEHDIFNKGMQKYIAYFNFGQFSWSHG